MSTTKYSPLSDASQEGTPSPTSFISKSYFSQRRPLKCLFVISFLFLAYFMFISYRHARYHSFGTPHQTISSSNILLDEVLLNLIGQLNSQSYNKFFIIDEDILRHALNPEPNTVSKNSVALGIFAPFDDKFDLELLTICSAEIGILCEYKQSDSFNLDDSQMQLMSHLIVSNNKHICHITLFREVGEDALFVSKVNSPDNIKIHLNTTSHDEVYSEFSIECVGQNIYVPSNIQFFLREKKSAQFIDCDRETAKKFVSSSPPKEVQYNTKKSVSHIKSLMRRLDAEVWLMSGTLLGWYRECKAIDHTTDADFATWSSNANTKFEDELLQLSSSSLFKSRPYFRVFNIFGTFGLGYEVSFLLPNKFKSDLFFLYPEGKNQVVAVGHVVKENLYYKYLYPSFKVCSSIFLGLKVNVPCNPEAILSAEYGEWKTPVTDNVYDYKSSPKNRGPPIPYPDDMSSIVRFY